MPSPDELSLVPIDPLRAAEVTRGGKKELAEFKEEQARTKAMLLIWSMLTATAAVCTALMLPEGLIFYGVFLFVTIFGAMMGGSNFWKLAGAKSWQALPEGATETTALLEDALTKAIHAWNADNDLWIHRVAKLELDIAAWRKRSEDASLREDGWSEASHAMDRETLVTRGKGLMLERRDLQRRRDKIGRAMGHLGDAVRRGELESQEPDPEPE